MSTLLLVLILFASPAVAAEGAPQQGEPPSTSQGMTLDPGARVAPEDATCGCGGGGSCCTRARLRSQASGQKAAGCACGAKATPSPKPAQ